MKIRIEKSPDYASEPEIVIYCNKVDNEVEEIISSLDLHKKKLVGLLEGREHMIELTEVLYCESVDGDVYIYTENRVYKTTYILYEIESGFRAAGYFRCSKSMILNIHSIKSLKSELGNRIDAVLINGEHIIISRHYAKLMRQMLKGAGNL